MASSPAIAAPAVEQTRRHLIALRAGGQTYRFLAGGYDYLEEAEDGTIAVEMLRALVELGLGGPARELVRSGHLDQSRIDVDELRRSLAQIPTGRVPWAELREKNFDRNLEALTAGRPWLGSQAAGLADALRDHHLYRSLDGQLHVARRRPGRLVEWIGGLRDAAAVATMELAISDTGPVPIVTGVGLDRLVQRVFERTQAGPAKPQVPIFVLENELARFAAWLHAEDHTQVLSDPRVLIFIGPGAVESCERFLNENEDISVPGASVWSFPPQPLDQLASELASRVMTRRKQAARELVKHLQQRADTGWAKPLRPGSTVLGITSRFTTMLQYSMRDIGHVLEQLGYRFRLHIEQDDHRGHTTLTTSRAIHEHDPALVVLINHMRYEQPRSLGAVPILTWIQDPTPELLCSAAGASIGPRDFVCGFYADRCAEEFGYPRERFCSIPFLPVSAWQFHDGALPAGRAERYECDVAYVGHFHGTVESFRERAISSFPETIQPLLARIADDVLERTAAGCHIELADAAQIVDEQAQTAGAELPGDLATHLANFFAYRLFDIHFRLETLRWVAEWARRNGRRFLIYGRGWEAHPELGSFARGPIEHGADSRLAYRGAAVTIQTTPGGLSHQRTFEALLSGSLVLGRYCPAYFEGLTMEEFRLRHGAGTREQRTLYAYGFTGLDRVCFEGPDQLHALLERHLTAPESRQALQREMAELVKRNFTYETVVPQVMERLRASLSAA